MKMAKLKIKNLLTDLTGQMRADKKRKACIKAGSPVNDYSDPIKDLCQELHPEFTEVEVREVEDVSLTARRIFFKPLPGFVLPPFEAGQYAVIDLEIGNTKTSRPYSICSAPYQARQGEESFFAITVRKGKPGEGFASDFLYETKPGARFTVHLPFGHFNVEPLRDSNNLVALAGGSGITPFLSMGLEIAHGTLDATLTILYGSASYNDIVLEKQLSELTGRCKKIKVVNVISGEGLAIKEGDEKGFLSAEVISKYMGADPTFFVCGPLPMYRFVSRELEKLNIPKRRIRMEVFGGPKDIRKDEGYPASIQKQTFSLTVVRGIHETVIPALSTESLAVSLERAGIYVRTCCRSGSCGACRVEVLSGDFFVAKEGDGRRMADKANGFVHSCSTYPLSDMKIKVSIH